MWQGAVQNTTLPGFKYEEEDEVIAEAFEAHRTKPGYAGSESDRRINSVDSYSEPGAIVLGESRVNGDSGDLCVNEKAEKVARLLLDDAKRQSGRLEQEQIDRLLAKKDLTADETLFVYQRLSQHGVDVDSEDDLEESGGDDVPPVPPGTSYAHDSLDFLMSVAKQYKLLTAVEERELGRSIVVAEKLRAELDSHKEVPSELREQLKRGDAARNHLILCNLRLVVSIARQFASMTEIPLTDLVQDGIFGLIRAVEKYDYSLGYKFSTYATWWIRQAVLRAIGDKGRAVRLPVHVVENVSRLRSAIRFLQRLNGGAKQPSNADLADELGWTIDKVAFCVGLMQSGMVRLDQPVSEDGGTRLVDLLASPEPTPDENVLNLDGAEHIQEALAYLTPREAKVIRMRFGINMNAAHTLEEIGRVFDVTRERIRQIEAKALRRLRNGPDRDVLHDLYVENELGNRESFRGTRDNEDTT